MQNPHICSYTVNNEVYTTLNGTLPNCVAYVVILQFRSDNHPDDIVISPLQLNLLHHILTMQGMAFQLGPGLLCQHNFEYIRSLKALSIMLA